MGTLPRFAQFIDSPTGHHLTAMTDKGLKHLLEIEQLRLAVDQRHHVDAEHTLHLGLLIEVIKQHLGDLTALEFDHHAHAVLIGLVAQLGDAFDLLLLDQLGDLLQQTGLVDLIRQLGDDDALAAALHLLHLGTGAHVDTAAARMVGLMNAGSTVDNTGGREIGARYILHQA